MMVVMLLIGVFATVFLPRMFRRSPAVEWKTIADELNNLVAFARQEAIANQKVYRLVFKRNPNAADTVSVEEEAPHPEKPGRVIYKSVSSYYFSTTYRLADAVKLKAVYLGKQEMFEELRGVAYCFVIHDGLVQDVLVQLERRINNIETIASFKMNPFLGRFGLHEGVLKPER